MPGIAIEKGEDPCYLQKWNGRLRFGLARYWNVDMSRPPSDCDSLLKASVSDDLDDHVEKRTLGGTGGRRGKAYP